MNADAIHPYKTAPDRAFWSRSVSANFDSQTLIGTREPLIKRSDKVVSAGSCFASNLVPYLEKSGLNYFRTESMHPAFAHATADNFGYSKFSAAYGNIYTVRQLLQLLRRALDQFQPVESHWDQDGDIVDPFRPGLRYRARTTAEFTALTKQHLARTKLAFTAADVFVLTLGLTEAWISSADGSVFPACPGTIAGKFDPDRHLFHNFSASEVSGDLNSFITELRAVNESCRFIITVSPVPLVATATADHVLCASTYSKAVLRVAAQEAVLRHSGVTYFPAYELVTGPQAPDSYFSADKRNVTNEAVEAVMSTLISHCESTSHDVAPTLRTTKSHVARSTLANLISEAECEEVMSSR